MYYSDLVTAVNDYIENNFPTVDLNRMIQQTEQRIYNTVQLPSLRRNVTGSMTSQNQYISLPNDFLSAYSLAVINNGQYTYLLNKDVNFIREAYPTSGYYAAPVHYAIFGPSSSNQNELTLIVGPTPDQSYGVELHYYYYPVSIIQAAINGLSISNGGSGYTNGTYYNVSLLNGTGNSASATIVVSGNVVTSVTLVDSGCYYSVGDVLTATFGGGLNFSCTVTGINNQYGETWLGDNFDSALLNGTLMEAITYIKGGDEQGLLMKLYQERYTASMALLKNLGDGKLRMDAYRDGQVRVPVA
jgi:hypothetical protein